MTYDELKTYTRKQAPSIALDRVFPKRWRWVLRVLALTLLVISFIISILENMEALAAVEGLYADGFSLLLLGLLMILLHLEYFYYSGRFANLQNRLKERFSGETKGPDYATARIMAETDQLDITAGFVASPVSRRLFTRLDISEDALRSFLANGRNKMISSLVTFNSDHVSFYDYSASLYDQDASFRAFLSSNSVNEEHYLGAAKWLSRAFDRQERKTRFWSRDNLESLPSLATTWSYGIPVEISKYGAPFEYKADLGQIDLSVPDRETEVDKLENILSRDKGANVVIVDDEERNAKTIIARIYKKIKLGSSLSTLEHKRIVELEWSSLIADKHDKASFEAELLDIFSENVSVGNIIIYIPNLPQFINSAKNIGASITNIMEEFLKSKRLQLIAQAGRMDFHNFIETSPGLVTSFERVVPEEESPQASMDALTEKAEVLESRWNIVFSYQALAEVAESAYRHIVYGEMPQKALDLLAEITPWASRERIKILRKSDVSAYMEQKTGIPSSEITGEEAQKLERLEEIMHNRIVGQQAAVQAIGGALRRARSGLTDSDRPFASFLFLGPTGVGKTETCKALAEVFFGGEDKMMRFDMSEYSGADALPKLIGSFNENRSGILAARLRDNPYGVLLLDEFEKASPDVHDLFLQILDEGLFSDALGNKVNCRNLIIIATSNAGSALIWQMVEKKQDLARCHEEIIHAIIAEKVFKPELLNRFDGVIIFSPLHNGDMLSVAAKMFDKFARKLEEEKQIKIVGSPELLAYLVQEGGNEEFGARSINRVIQDKVEDFVARKIIAGQVHPGSTLEVKLSDVQTDSVHHSSDL